MVAMGSTVDDFDSGVGEGSVGNAGVLSLLTVFILYSALLVYAAMAFWPPVLPVATDPTIAPPDTTTTFFGTQVTIAREQNLILLVGILGSLGGMAYVLRSFSKYVGQRRLRWSWVASYVASPFLGGVMATIVYILLRAGLIGGAGSVEGNTWGFAAIATLVGLFNMQTASKLKDVFEVLLASSDGGRKDRDQLEAGAQKDAGAANASATGANAGGGNGTGGNGTDGTGATGAGSTSGDGSGDLTTVVAGGQGGAGTNGHGGVAVVTGTSDDGGTPGTDGQSAGPDASSEDTG